MQQQMGVFEPDFGHLLTDMLYAADAPIEAAGSGSRGPSRRSRLILADELRGPGLSVADVMTATAYALPAIEIIDSRITDWKIGLVDTDRRQRVQRRGGARSEPGRGRGT